LDPLAGRVFETAALNYVIIIEFLLLFNQNDIKEVHTAAIYGEVEAIDHKEFRQHIYAAKDINGISALHKVSDCCHTRFMIAFAVCLSIMH
jgi:hypothetical protein